MPECLVLGEQGDRWLMQLENWGDTWRCGAAQDADDAWYRLHRQPYTLAVIGRDSEGARLLTMLQERPPLSPPWLLTEADCAWADGQTSLLPTELPCWLEKQERAGRIPRLAMGRYQQLLCLARGLMVTLNVPSRLRAWDFLPDMLALLAVHPALTEDLRGRMYPLMARRHGLSPAAVERRLRLAIESTWSGASLSALERFFGHSVDPERGKPTNREFLFRVQERLLLAARRIA